VVYELLELEPRASESAVRVSAPASSVSAVQEEA
jgi:hypothetical protein